MAKPIYVDLTQYDSGKPHWLSPQGRRPDIALRVREKYRNMHKVQQALDRTTRQADKIAQRVREPKK
jgi:hypothetical protein